VRLHISPALVAAKYADVREEANTAVDILLEGAKADLSAFRHFVPSSKTSRSQPGTFSQSRTSSRSNPPSHWKPLVQATSQVKSKTDTQPERLSQTKAPSSKTRSRTTPSTHQSPRTFAPR